MKCDTCFHEPAGVDEQLCVSCTRSLSRREFLDLVFIGLAYFFCARLAYYIFSGEFVRSDAYFSGQWHVFWGLRDFAFPISIEAQPLYSLVIGTFFSVLLAVPLLVGAFYNMIAGMFLGLVAGALFMPGSVLAALLPAGALIAGSRFIRFRSGFCRLLLALAPPTAYLVYRTFEPPAALSAVRSGALRLANTPIALVPWGWALALTAALFGGASAAVTRRRYDARFLLPWTLAGAAACLVLVSVGAGFDRINYAFVYNGYSVGSGFFTNYYVEQGAVGTSGRQFKNETTGEVIDPGTNFMKICFAIGEADKATAAEAFDRFVRRFPSSRFVADATYQKARALNLKLDLHLLKTTERIVVGTSRITRQAMDAYDVVRSLSRKGPQAILAAYETALYHFQHGDFKRALDACAEIRVVYDGGGHQDASVMLLPPEADPYGPVSGAASPTKRIYDPFETDKAARRLAYRRVSFLIVSLAAKLERTIKENSDFDRLPLAQFAALDPYADSYTTQLDRLIGDNADSNVLDNMLLAKYTAHGNIDREGLLAVLSRFPEGDVVDEVHYHLGLACFHAGRTGEALEHLQKVTANATSPKLLFARYLVDRIEAGEPY